MKKKEFLTLSPEELQGIIKPVDKALLESLDTVGQVAPLLISGSQPPFVVIDGHKRLIVLQGLSRAIECLRLVECDLFEAVEEEIRMNSHRGLTMLEKSACMKRLLQLDPSEEELMEALKSMKLPKEKRVLQNLMSVAELPEEEQAFFVSRNFGEYLLSLIFNLKPEDRSTFLLFCGKYHLNHNQGRDVLEKLLQVQNSNPIKSLLCPWLEKLRFEPEKGGLFLKRFFRELDTLCNRNSKTSQNLEEIKKSLPKNLKLDEKEYLKNGAVSLTVRMCNGKDAERAVAVLSKLFR